MSETWPLPFLTGYNVQMDSKNASMSDYRKATGFEALMGYLYLKDDMERIVELTKLGLEKAKILH